ncbi:hypothetical protein OUZ56_006883 [Daphnia magna]|uniref:Uncharacterized protein n=1 Tax=Daphnia magna TaxID=35525 RepID=A0ABQ9YWZ1_9CRUS|nr:hypothetical protein OUZ56_006883 [Daphnia magna]
MSPKNKRKAIRGLMPFPEIEHSENVVCVRKLLRSIQSGTINEVANLTCRIGKILSSSWDLNCQHLAKNGKTVCIVGALGRSPHPASKCFGSGAFKLN